MNRRAFLRGVGTTTLVAAAGASLVACGVDTHDVETKRVPLYLGLNKPLRVAVLGDFHFDPVYEDAYFEYISDCVAELKTDLVVYTGDFITHMIPRLDDLAGILARSVSRLGSFATLGNHDHWSGAGEVTAALERKGIRVLRNQCFALPDEEGFFLTGLDSFWGGTPDVTIFSRTPANSRHIVLVHEPDPFLHLDDPRIKLQISGHTHGGQIRVPLFGALHLPEWGKNYQEGLFEESGRYLYVNRGVGTLKPHVRINCRPEITLLELT